MDIDTGSAVSAINYSTYISKFKDLKLQKSRTILKTYNGSNIHPRGLLNMLMKIDDVVKEVEILVVDGGGPPLMGRDLIDKFNICWPQGKNNFSLEISDILTQNVQNKLHKLLKNYSELFKDNIGLLRYEKIKLSIPDNTKPKFFKPRTIPFAFKTKVEAELQRLEEAGIITLIPNSDWGTPLVPVLKKAATDHKPLIYIFGEKKGIPAMAASRLQRWSVFLSNFDFTIEYVKGDQNSNADCLSRLPLPSPEKSKLEYSYLNFVTENVDIPVSAEHIKREIQDDPVLFKVYEFIRNGWPNYLGEEDNLVRPYYLRKHDMTIEAGIIMLGHRVVIPNKFKERSSCSYSKQV
ncbi:hypothetical protein QE152_g9202 [Popillia japonica]|uniref:Reverse transcriptase domain-containing protein n=1 Tax=Popillia japonica TaxID=7064 RepID=A0AAW1M252_POPJA